MAKNRADIEFCGRTCFRVHEAGAQHLFHDRQNFLDFAVSRQALQEFGSDRLDFAGEGKPGAVVPGADQRPQLVDVAGLAGFENEAVHYAPDRFRQALKIVDDLRQGASPAFSAGLPFVIFAIL